MKYPVKALFKKASAIGGNFESIQMQTHNKGWENTRTGKYQYFLEEEQC